jgi:ubiquinone/menaquinone biosynthesis C-methylase UbiE
LNAWTFCQSLDCFRRYKARSLDLLGGVGSSVVDVACGQGDDVVRLKQQFDRAVEVDASYEMIAEARRRHGDTDVSFT